MFIKTEMSPYDFLKGESWECEDLKEAIDKNNASETFNNYVEDFFNYSEEIPSATRLNDFLRFNSTAILEALGIEESEN